MGKLLKLALATSFLGLFSISSALACPGHDKEKQAAAEQQKAAPGAQVATASFRVDKMHCGGCADDIKAALAKAEGVLKVDVKVADKRVVVSFDKAKISADKIAKLISDAGFPANAEV